MLCISQNNQLSYDFIHCSINNMLIEKNLRHPNGIYVVKQVDRNWPVDDNMQNLEGKNKNIKTMVNAYLNII